MAGGRPRRYNAELAEDICRQIAEGMSLRQICKQDGMPGISTVVRWLFDEECKEFWAHYARAREIQAELLADELMDIADDSANDYMDRINNDGSKAEVLNAENIQRSRLRIDTRKWVAAKLLPKRYGEKTEVVQTGTIEHVHKTAESLPLNDIRSKATEAEQRTH